MFTHRFMRFTALWVLLGSAPATAQAGARQIADVATDSGHYTVAVTADGNVVLTAAAFPRPVGCAMRADVAVLWAKAQRAVLDSSVRAGNAGRIELENETGVNTDCHGAIRRVVGSDDSRLHLHLHDDGYLERATIALTRPEADSLLRTVVRAANQALNIEPGMASSARPYFEFEVTKRVQQLPGTGHLRYPEQMRKLNMNGEVLAQFIVDARGNYEPGSFKVIHSTDAEFTEAVRAALPTMHFSPAEVDGRKVRQLVQQPFTFSLSY